MTLAQLDSLIDVEAKSLKGEALSVEADPAESEDGFATIAEIQALSRMRFG
jgi:hypothetical protein